ncbi:hypothetical protein STEG23_001580, partial [Scotinomys teguina]
MLKSVLLPEIVWKPMIHAALTAMGNEASFIVAGFNYVALEETRTLDSLELELWLVVNTVWVLGIGSGSLQEQLSCLSSPSSIVSIYLDKHTRTYAMWNDQIKSSSPSPSSTAHGLMWHTVPGPGHFSSKYFSVLFMKSSIEDPTNVKVRTDLALDLSQKAGSDEDALGFLILLAWFPRCWRYSPNTT